MRKQHLAIEIFKIVKIHCKVDSIQSLFGDKLQFRSQHTNCMSYYDDVISCDITYLVFKDVLTNKEQLYQSFRNCSSSKNLKLTKSI